MATRLDSSRTIKISCGNVKWSLFTCQLIYKTLEWRVEQFYNAFKIICLSSHISWWKAETSLQPRKLVEESGTLPIDHLVHKILRELCGIQFVRQSSQLGITRLFHQKEVGEMYSKLQRTIINCEKMVHFQSMLTSAHCFHWKKIHLINVTMFPTIGGDSQREQTDRSTFFRTLPFIKSPKDQAVEAQSNEDFGGLPMRSYKERSMSPFCSLHTSQSSSSSMHSNRTLRIQQSLNHRFERLGVNNPFQSSSCSGFDVYKPEATVTRSLPPLGASSVVTHNSDKAPMEAGCTNKYPRQVPVTVISAQNDNGPRHMSLTKRAIKSIEETQCHVKSNIALNNRKGKHLMIKMIAVRGSIDLNGHHCPYSLSLSQKVWTWFPTKPQS